MIGISASSDDQDRAIRIGKSNAGLATRPPIISPKMACRHGGQLAAFAICASANCFASSAERRFESFHVSPFTFQYGKSYD